MQAPALLQPVDLPEDAAGRVEVIAMTAPADVLDTPDAPAPRPEERTPGHWLRLLLARDGWLAIAALAVVLVIVFLIGVGLTH